MKTLLLMLSMLITFNVSAYDLTFDPNLPGNSTLTITCNFKLERANGEIIAIGDIAKASYYISTNGGTFVNINADTPTCEQVFDMSQVTDGDYVYAVTEIDSDGRESELSSSRLSVLVKRLAPPGAPDGVTGSKS